VRGRRGRARRQAIGDDLPRTLAEHLVSPAVLVAHEVGLAGPEMLDDAGVERVELGADRQPLIAPRACAPCSDHRIGRWPEHSLELGGHRRSSPPCRRHRLRDETAPLLGRRLAPVDIEHRDRRAHGRAIDRSGMAPELGGEPRDRLVEAMRRAEVHRLRDVDPEIAPKQLVCRRLRCHHERGLVSRSGLT
jgi:hypothetical protein